MEKRIYLKIILLIFVIVLTFDLSLRNLAITIPEKDINLKIENLTPGCEVYLLLPEELLKYNMEQFIANNKDNVYNIQADKSSVIEEYLNDGDYLGYIDYFRSLGYAISYNEIELRHYCFCLGDREVIGYYEHDGVNYVQIKINLNDQNEFKLITKDYLVNYDSRNIKFLIDEYGTETFIDLSNKTFVTNAESSNIIECNVDFQFYTTEDYGEIQRAIDLAYIILIILFIFAVVFVTIVLWKKHKAKKEEKAARRFWEKKLTKEEKKAEKKKLKEEKKLAKKNKNKKR